jgi:hypothetical protein
MSKELDILANLFNKLSDDERQELLDLVDKDKTTSSKKEQVNHFLEMEIDDNPKIRNVSRKLTKTAKKDINKNSRREVRMIDVDCKNCGKTFNLPENYPNIKGFICCLK